MEWIEQYGAAGAFVLLVLKMFLEARRGNTATDTLEELRQHRVTPERLARLITGLERRLELLPDVVLNSRMRQVEETHQNVRDLARAIEKGGPRT
jgi:hypothetical protein